MSAHLVGGYLADVYGAKRVLTFGVVWWSLFTILTPPSARLQWAVILVRFLMGAGEGINFPAVYALASEWYPEHEEHMLVTIAEMGVYLGIVVAMVCVPVIEQSIGWEPVFYIFGSFGFVWGAFFWLYGYDTPGRARASGMIDERSTSYYRDETQGGVSESSAEPDFNSFQDICKQHFKKIQLPYAFFSK